MSTTKTGGAFLISSTEPKEIFTPKDLSEDQLMIAKSAKEFSDKELLPNKEKFEKKDYQLAQDMLKKCGELGMLSIAIPAENEGMGMDFNTTLLVCDRVSGVSGSFSTAFGAHTGIGTMPIVWYGNQEQKATYLPKLGSGEWAASYCLTEPTAGSDANSGKSRAVLSDDGKHYIITGQKMWITNAGFADVFIVFAKIEDDKNLTAFIVEKGDNGIELGPEEDKLGIRSSSTRQVFFNQTKIPVDRLLGKRNEGFKIAMNVLNAGRIKLAAGSLDAARRLITLSAQYANERKQFNIPIAKFEAIQEKIADMTTQAFVAEAATYRTSGEVNEMIEALIESGVSKQEAELKGMEQFAVECALNKVYGSEMTQFVSDEAIQVYGGMGYSADSPIESAWRDARITRIYEGTNEINRMLAVGMLVKKSMKGELDLMSPAMKVMGELMEIPDFDTPDYSAPLSQELDLLAKAKKLGLLVAGKAVQEFGMELDKHQQVLMKIADIMIQIYATESVILRTLKEADSDSDAEKELKLAICQLQTFQAMEIIGTKAKEAIISVAQEDEQRMMLMAMRRYTKYQEYPNPSKLKKQIAKHVLEANAYCLDFIA